jgi:hypothetical protein
MSVMAATSLAVLGRHEGPVMSKMPNLFVIGAMKCGTTTLHEHLQSHPHVFMCSPKEPHFFVQEMNWSKGWAWYRQLFAEAGDAAVLGESSTTYSMLPHFQGVAERIAAFNPEARFIYVLRDPVERTLSHYWHMVRFHGEVRDMLTAIRETERWRAYSNYTMQLEPYLDAFGRERIHALTFEEMISRPEEVIRGMFAWLGLDPSLATIEVDLRANTTPEEIVHWPSFVDRYRNSPWWTSVGPWVPPSLRNLGKQLLGQRMEQPEEVVRATIDYLRPIQQEETRQLSELLGRPFDDWHTLYARNSN